MTDGIGVPRPAADPRAAMVWAGRQFKDNAVAYASLAAVVTVIQFLQQVSALPLLNVLQDCLDAATPGQSSACEAAVTGALPASGITLVLVLVAAAATAGVQRAALGSTGGTPPTFAQMLSTRHLGRYVLYTVAAGLLIGVGLILCLLPGLMAYLLLQLGFYFVLDRGTGVFAAIRASSSVVMANVGPAFSVATVNILALLLGGLLYGIPTLVTLPFACLFTAHMYRQFAGEPVW